MKSLLRELKLLSVAADVSALNVAYFRELNEFFFTCDLVYCLVNIGLPVISFVKHARCLTFSILDPSQQRVLRPSRRTTPFAAKGIQM